MRLSQLTFKAHGNLFRRNHFHGNGLFVRVQIQVLYPRPSMPRVRLVVIFAIVLAVTFPPFTCKNGVEFACCGRGFGAGFFLLLCVGIEAREQVANDKVGY